MTDPDFESEFDVQYNAGAFTNYTSEFIFDSDEGSPLPDRPQSAGADSFHPMEDAPQDYGSPSGPLGLAATGPRSMGSSYESTPDSDSSKGTSSTTLTALTMGDLPMDVSGGLKVDFGNIMGGTTDGLPLMHGLPSGHMTMQMDMRSPSDTPSPLGSGFPAMMDVSMASPGAETGLSYQTACEDSLMAFNFEPSTARGDASSSLCLRPSQHVQSPPPKFEFRGALEEPRAFAPDMSTFFNPGHGLGAGGPYFPAVMPQGPFDYNQYGPGPYRLEVDVNNSKSRVETQILVKLRLSHLPPGVTKVHLPKHTISKPKFWAKPVADPSPDMLELHTVLVCSSAMQAQQHKVGALRRAEHAARSGRNVETDEKDQIKTQEGGEVRICHNCIGRERKRAGRKKSKSPEDEEAWKRDEDKRVIVFNTQEVKDWALQKPPESGLRSFYQVEAPMRIACYCRHHTEKVGFQIIFTMTDHRGHVVAQTMSRTIMITDDHKTTSPKPGPRRPPSTGTAMLSPREDMPPQNPPGYVPSLESSPSPGAQTTRRNSAEPMPLSTLPTDQLQPTLAAQARTISRPASPSFQTGAAKRRRNNNSVVKIPKDLSMTRLDTSALHSSRVPASAPGTAAMTPVTSPFPPTPPAVFPQTGGPPPFGSGNVPAEPLTNPFGNNLQSAANSQMLLPNLSRSSSLANLTMPIFGLQPATRTNPAASPPAARPAPSVASGQARAQQPQAQPAIFKVIPGEGPVAGGIEVTLMGQGFYNGIHVMFGDKQAPATTFWSSESLVCLLPPSEVSGMVPVTFRGQNLQSQNQNQWFRYIDDSEQQLLRTALMILGTKMTGGYEDVAEFARRIIKEAASAYPSPGGDMHGPEGSSNRPIDNFEGHLLKLLELMDLSNSTQKPRLNLRRSTGQTMLHLASKLGLHRFVAGLLARGANPDRRDKGGYTAMHMASMSNYPQIVRLLIAHGADPTLRTLSGLTAADVAKSNEVVAIIQRFEQHRRARNGSSPQSRVSSVASLNAMLADVSLSQTAVDSSDEPRSEEESPAEYSEVDSSDIQEEAEDGEQQQQGLHIRRVKSAVNTPARRRSPSRPRGRRGTDASGPLGLPSAAMTAIKEQVATQFQQIQQMVGPRFQHLPQFPQFPQLPHFPQLSYNLPMNMIPNMPMLPDYQQTAVYQRLANMIGAARPGAEEMLPPSYDDLFPGRGGDGGSSERDLYTKKESCARAAGDAAADAKCAALFDQTEEATTVVPSTTVAVRRPLETPTEEQEDSEGQEIPAMLQIGRKDAITVEQQATLRRAHAKNLKRLSWDRNLFFIWIPLLTLMVGVMIYQGLPALTAATKNFRAEVVQGEAPLVQQVKNVPVVGGEVPTDERMAAVVLPPAGVPAPEMVV